MDRVHVTSRSILLEFLKVTRVVGNLPSDFPSKFFISMSVEVGYPVGKFKK